MQAAALPDHLLLPRVPADACSSGALYSIPRAQLVPLLLLRRPLHARHTSLPKREFPLRLSQIIGLRTKWLAPAAPAAPAPHSCCACCSRCSQSSHCLQSSHSSRKRLTLLVVVARASVYQVQIECPVLCNICVCPTPSGVCRAVARRPSVRVRCLRP